MDTLSRPARMAVASLEEREIFTLFRRRHGLRQEDVGARVGLVQPIVSMWERGRYRLDEETVERLWDAAREMAAEAEAEQETAGAEGAA